ncbi:MAG TPA: decarboxylating NADP(+)-dependent phosphogluconate dehydrogenase [Oligoflexia bacterium]|mgnify:CR=1 FL=1|nr:decarboxylating NADP(+)-dependent phosphogluconate dehydrogenase [Oligoflexia bacterium]HMP49658.1 decarboxylating NADP(+)-dependent phosphogluconate dehydrogenase [Oligoflexia bacterium]
MSLSNIGLIGLAVMGENLVLNMESKGFSVSVFNRNTDRVKEFVSGRAAGKNIKGCLTVRELCESLERPRKIMIMVKAGSPVDDVIEQLLPFLESGDIIIDGGNSHFPDSNRRTQDLAKKGILFVGAGVSGGEEGALHGPSIMPGGNKDAWPHVKNIFQTISAKVEDGSPCCDWVGQEGAGHFVKMVHNGIEYGDMQLICEAYDVLKSVAKCSNSELHQVFSEWNKGDLDSFLIEITADIFSKKDDETGKDLIDVILDKAGQKGTGKWTINVALDLGIPATLMGEAVFSRCLSAVKDERVTASKILKGPSAVFSGEKKLLIDATRDAIYCAKIVSYAQGFSLLAAASKEFNWSLDYGAIALMWRGGCIIRSKFLGKIKEAFDRNRDLKNLMLDPFFTEVLHTGQAGWRKVVMTAAEHGIPVPAISTALGYFDAYRTERLPANLLQAQRDYFGAHTYERLDKPRGEMFHTNWTGRGGTTASTSYNA